MKIKGIALSNQSFSPTPPYRKKNKTLTFDLNNTDHGIGIQHIVEIIQIQDITKVPDMPIFIGGTINFQGKTVPILDLCSNSPESCTSPTRNNLLIVVTIEDSMIGLVVDQIKGVASSASPIAPANHKNATNRRYGGKTS